MANEQQTPDYMKQFDNAYENSGSSGGGGDYIRYTIKDLQGAHNVTRLIGAPRFFRRGWVVDDNEKKFPISFAKDSILQSIINKVLTYKWIPAPPELRSQKEVVKQFTNEQTHPDIFWMVKQNSSRDPKETGWEGTLQYPFNCIDRQDNWCAENKHFKLLAKSQYDLGINWTSFNALKNDVVSDYGPYEGYDIDFKKVIDEAKNKTTYSAHRADKNIPELAPLVIEGPLSEMEKAYIPYNLDEVSKNTSATLILKHLRQKIGRIDHSLKTTYIRDLEIKAEEEEKEKQAAQAAAPQQAQAPIQQQPIQQQAPVQQAPIQQPVQQAPVQQPVQQAPVQSEPAPVKQQEQPVQQQAPIQQQPAEQPVQQQQAPVQEPQQQPVQQPVQQQAPVQQPQQSVQQQQPVQQQPQTAAPQAAQNSLPCVKCNQAYPITDKKCPHCGYEEVIS